MGSMGHMVILVIHVFLAVAIIGLVLLQRGKGADAGAGFGSGASGTVFRRTRLFHCACRKRPQCSRHCSL